MPNDQKVEEVKHLQQLLDNTANNTDGARISMSLVEAINTAQNEYNQCVNRQQKLLGDLKQKRSDRLSKQIKQKSEECKMWWSQYKNHLQKSINDKINL